MKRSIIGVLLGIISLPMLTIWAAAPPFTRQEIPDAIKGAEGLEEAIRNLKASLVQTPVLSPQEQLKSFRIREGYQVQLLAAEPVVKQPVHLTFDPRGRLWITQYRQYPLPAGLKVVAYDRYIRAKFDKIPPPPPHHFKGQDRITIHEDSHHDGTFAKTSIFLDGLNIATACLPDQDGVWVLNPPYLLFYPTKDDIPGTPVVHLSGFGLEDTHAVANSLTWGPDGWIYGAQGSTCTAKVRVEVTKAKQTVDFLGQAIWRYHPKQHRFEIFAEGGGNTFGVAFSEGGHLFSGTNWGRYRGLHYVQGGYYIKGWGKHGPLTNPYALGYFEHMPHVGNADRLVHTFAIYGDGLMPDLRGKLIGVNALQRRIQVTQLKPQLSSFTTYEEPYLLTSEDGRFRPVDIKVGPEGALYIADLYEPRINHVDPRDNWDKTTGRVWKIIPCNYKPAPLPDFTRLSNEQLIQELKSNNRTARETAMRVLGWRRPKSLREPLLTLVRLAEDRTATAAYLALHQADMLDESTALIALARDKTPHLRRWAVRLLGDQGLISEKQASALIQLARHESNPTVRSQLASTAKRLPAQVALPMVAALWDHDADANDPHLPLLTWWVIEAHAESAREAILELLGDTKRRTRPIVQTFILDRLIQRWVMAGGRDNLLAAAKLLREAKDDASRLLVGLERGFAGRSANDLPKELREAIVACWDRGVTTAQNTLGLRLLHRPAVESALRTLANPRTDVDVRRSILRVLSEVAIPEAIPVLLEVLEKSPSLRADTLAALGRYPDEVIARKVISLGLHRTPAGMEMLATRVTWSKLLLAEIEAKRMEARSIPFEIVRKLALHSELTETLNKLFGRIRGATPKEKQTEMVRYGNLLKNGKGDAKAGAAIYDNLCGKCHKLFGSGGSVGPELTGYERSSVLYWLENIVDPSAVIREEYLSFVVRTTNGQTLTGIISGQDQTTITLRDAEGRERRVARKRIEDIRADTTSLMPEGQLKSLSDQQIRDLFAYLMAPKKP